MMASKFGQLATAILLLGCSSTGSGGSGSGGGGGVAGMGTAGGGGATQPFSCTSSGSSAQMVGVPAGDFLMGCNDAVDAACEDDERPARTVTLSAFEIDVTEVTQDQYAACVAAGGCPPPNCDWNCDLSERPAMCLDFEKAKAFCGWAGKRLPTEAEWEKAARGTDGRKYPWGNEEPTCSLTNMQGCGDSLENVGSHPGGASPYGALDMSGNMVEMIADWYDSGYYSSAPNVDPKGPDVGDVIGGRGGGYKSADIWQRASARDWYDLDDSGTSLGFRCAR